MGKSCWMASLAIQQVFPIQILLYSRGLNWHQILYFNATDLKLGGSTYFCLLFSFLVLTKRQIVNLMAGRSRDQVTCNGPIASLRKAVFSNHGWHINIIAMFLNTKNTGHRKIAINNKPSANICTSQFSCRQPVSCHFTVRWSLCTFLEQSSKLCCVNTCLQDTYANGEHSFFFASQLCWIKWMYHYLRVCDSCSLWYQLRVILLLWGPPSVQEKRFYKQNWKYPSEKG